MGWSWRLPDRLLLIQILKQCLCFEKKRWCHPFFNGYRPQFYFRTTDVTGVVTLPEGTGVMLDNVEFDVELITPIAMDKNCDLQFVKAVTLLVRALLRI